MQYDGLSVLVSGGASGLGRAVVSALSRTGAEVVVLDLPGTDPGDDPGVRFVATDVTDPEQVRAAVASVEAPLRAAICCAGVATPGRILSRKGNLAASDFARVVQVNLVGTFTVL